MMKTLSRKALTLLVAASMATPLVLFAADMGGKGMMGGRH
jgi:hypothetical protein